MTPGMSPQARRAVAWATLVGAAMWALLILAAIWVHSALT